MTITIPPVALEAAARETYIEWIRGCLLNDPTASIDDYERWEHLDETERGHYISTARAACLALIENWPGMGPIRTDQPIGDWCDKLPAIILPLSQEKQNG